MTKEQVIQGYLMNSPKVVAEMLYNTIEKYENRSCENRSCDNCKTKNCSVRRILVEKDEISTDYFNCNEWIWESK